MKMMWNEAVQMRERERGREREREYERYERPQGSWKLLIHLSRGMTSGYCMQMDL
jgi:hypothetical protein